MTKPHGCGAELTETRVDRTVSNEHGPFSRLLPTYETHEIAPRGTVLAWVVGQTIYCPECYAEISAPVLVSVPWYAPSGSCCGDFAPAPRKVEKSSQIGPLTLRGKQVERGHLADMPTLRAREVWPDAVIS